MSFTQREARGLIRKAVARVPEGEAIRHLNIMPMMDMMTILLVAFIFQMATSALELTAGTVALPSTDTDAPVPESARTIHLFARSSCAARRLGAVCGHNDCETTWPVCIEERCGWQSWTSRDRSTHRTD